MNQEVDKSTQVTNNLGDKSFSVYTEGNTECMSMFSCSSTPRGSSTGRRTSAADVRETFSHSRSNSFNHPSMHKPAFIRDLSVKTNFVDSDKDPASISELKTHTLFGEDGRIANRYKQPNLLDVLKLASESEEVCEIGVLKKKPSQATAMADLLKEQSSPRIPLYRRSVVGLLRAAMITLTTGRFLTRVVPSE